MRRTRTGPFAIVPSRWTSCRASSRPEEWNHIKRGLAQRVRALNLFVDDVYHAREIVHAGVVPWSLIVSAETFARAVHGVRPPGGVCRVAVRSCATRTEAGRCWRTTCAPRRASAYVIENRIAMTRLVPQLFSTYRVRSGRPLPGAAAGGLARGCPGRRGRGNGRRVDSGTAEQRLLRACVPRPPDGSRARRGVGPRRPRRRLLHAHHQRAGPSERDLPAVG